MSEQIRGYKLKIFPTNSKSELIRYVLNRGQLYLKSFLGHELFSGKKVSTEGQGQLANQMANLARNKAKAIKECSKTTGNKWNVPKNPKPEVPVKLEKSKKSSYDYWVCVPNLFEKKKLVRVPAKSHKALNKAIKNGWKLSSWAYLKSENEIIVFVKKEVKKAEIPIDVIGVDVGLKRCITTSDGYRGLDLRPLIRSEKIKRSERFRQRTKYKQEISYKRKNDKTKIKQQINRYARSVINRARAQGIGVAVESSRVLINLKSGNLQGWARCAFFNRVQVLGKEEGVFVVGVNPAYTSKKCPDCRAVGNRDGINFTCENWKCNKVSVLQDADIVGGKNIQIEGRVALGSILRKSETRTLVRRT